jgi:hypothetical protein
MGFAGSFPAFDDTCFYYTTFFRIMQERSGDSMKNSEIGVYRWGELCFVGADVLDGPFRIPEKTLLGIRNLRGVEDVAPYVG